MDNSQQNLNLSERLSAHDNFYPWRSNGNQLTMSRADVTIRRHNNEEKSLRIPDEDLRIIEKIYHKKYDNVGRKRGALLRYIEDMRKNQEPDLTEQKKFLDKINHLISLY